MRGRQPHPVSANEAVRGGVSVSPPPASRQSGSQEPAAQRSASCAASERADDRKESRCERVGCLFPIGTPVVTTAHRALTRHHPCILQLSGHNTPWLRVTLLEPGLPRMLCRGRDEPRSPRRNDSREPPRALLSVRDHAHGVSRCRACLSLVLNALGRGLRRLCVT